MNTRVNFKMANLLEENGYPFEYTTVGEVKNVPLNIPTITEVVMWLYEKNGVWISVLPNEPYEDDDWVFIIFKNYKNNTSLEGYGSQNLAYEAAIEYTLKNLINI